MAVDRRKYDKEFKINAVKLAETSEKTQHELELDLGVGIGNISHWKKEFKDEAEKAFPGHGNIKEKDRELIMLKRENEILRQERDILKKALGIFSKTPG